MSMYNFKSISNTDLEDEESKFFDLDKYLFIKELVYYGSDTEEQEDGDDVYELYLFIEENGNLMMKVDNYMGEIFKYEIDDTPVLLLNYDDSFYIVAREIDKELFEQML